MGGEWQGVCSSWLAGCIVWGKTAARRTVIACCRFELIIYHPQSSGSVKCPYMFHNPIGTVLGTTIWTCSG